MEKILVSACLLGVNCRYDGENSESEAILDLRGKYNLVPVCPEILGGLSTPRDPGEICKGRVISSKGKDLTEEYIKGALETLKIAEKLNIKRAILKDKSPSCGKGLIYDGSFTSRKVRGNGVTTDILIKNNIDVISSVEVLKKI